MSHRNNLGPLIPPKHPIAPGGALLLGQKPAHPVVAERRSFAVLVSGETDGWNIALQPIAVRGVSAMEAQAILTEVAEQRLALNGPIAQMTDDGRVVVMMPRQQGDPQQGGGAPAQEAAAAAAAANGGAGEDNSPTPGV